MTKKNKKGKHNDWRRRLFELACYNGALSEELRCEQVGLMTKKAPKDVYKYMAAKYEISAEGDQKNRVFENLRTSKFWISTPQSFNDPFDCMVPPLLLDDDKKLWELRSELGVSCFSETCDSLLMWAHYADSHKGICVKYNMLELAKKSYCQIVPVLYSKDHKEIKKRIKVRLGAGIIASCLVKSEEWNYEKEWRLIKDKDACAGKWVDGHGALLDSSKPTAIYIGCEAEKELQDEIVDIGKKLDIAIFKMKKSKIEFRLAPERLT